MIIRTISFSVISNSIHHVPTSTSESFSFIQLLAKTALELSQCLYLISCSDSNRFKTLQGGPNHTIYGHSKSPTWLPFTSSHQSRHRRILPKDTVLTYLRTVASRPLSA